MSIQATACPDWCEIDEVGDDHADWAEAGRTQHRADRSIPLSAEREPVTVSLKALEGCEPVVILAPPAGSTIEFPMTCAEALKVAGAIKELTAAATGTAGHLTLVAGAA